MKRNAVDDERSINKKKERSLRSFSNGRRPFERKTSIKDEAADQENSGSSHFSTIPHEISDDQKYGYEHWLGPRKIASIVKKRSV